MQIFDPLELEKMSNGIWTNGKLPEEIRGFAFDTRELKKGDLFLALKGDIRDGHDYLDEAMRVGAVGAIVEKVDLNRNFPQLQVSNVLEAFQNIARKHREEFGGKIIGITGSCGKTTTKDLVSLLLGEESYKTFLNHNNLLGVPMTLMGLDNDLHKFGVIEAGMNIRGEMECLVSMIRPDISIITNIFPVHLEGVGEIKDIAREKAYLAEGTKQGGIVLFPKSCLEYEEFRSLGSKVRVLAKKEEVIEDLLENQIIRYEIEEDLDDVITIHLELPDFAKIYSFDLPMVSEGVIINVMLAISTALLLGVQPEEIRERLLNWVPSKYRGEIYQSGKQIYYADCYNANPASMLDALGVFQKRFKNFGRYLYVLGCMGELSDKAELYHYQVGKSLKLRDEDSVLLLGRDAPHYFLGLKDAGNDFSQIICLQNKEKAFEYLNGFEGAVFLKGSKPYALWELLPKEAALQKSRKIITC
ncbi:MAG: hypothetical protein C5B43_00025 [Verrucomicrobia bacterium]|nr:MAG: hypothetical protein C5B43_00025 [Verrucomicrobiota bacterium]